MTIERRKVRVKPRDYQPSKAELEEPIVMRNPDGSRASVEDLAAAALRPVTMVEDSDA